MPVYAASQFGAVAGGTSFLTPGSGMIHPGINLPGLVNINGNFAAAATINLVGVIPLILTAQYTLRAFANQVRSGLIAGNAVCAIYSYDGNTKLVDPGTNAFNLNSALVQVQTLATPFTIGPGTFRFAWGATATGTLANAGFYMDGITPQLWNGVFTNFVCSAANAIVAGQMPATLGTLTPNNNITNCPLYVIVV